MLRRGGLNNHQKMCVQLRLCEKNMLRNTVLYAGMKLKYYKDRLDASEQENIENGVKQSTKEATDEGGNVELLTEKLEECNTQNGNETEGVPEKLVSNMKAQGEMNNGNISKIVEDSNANSPDKSSTLDVKNAEQVPSV